jgi:V-type H+-transporting ATPase subunit H
MLLIVDNRRSKIIPILGDILNDSVKDKVTRIILAVFRNMIEKPEDHSISKENCVAMVQAKVLKQLSILQQHKFDDEDITADIDFLNEKLQISIQVSMFFLFVWCDEVDFT